MCIARTAHELGANKLARAALERLNELRLSPMAREAADAMAMRLKSRPMEDPEEMQPVCYRCGAVNPLLNTQVTSSRSSAPRSRSQRHAMRLAGPPPACA